MQMSSIPGPHLLYLTALPAGLCTPPTCPQPFSLLGLRTPPPENPPDLSGPEEHLSQLFLGITEDPQLSSPAQTHLESKIAEAKASPWCPALRPHKLGSGLQPTEETEAQGPERTSPWSLV